MEVYQISYNQIEILEKEYLNTKLREVIGNELLQKMGLYFDHESKARISFCAMLVCWAEIYKKAERASNRHIEHFLNQKESQLNMFRQIVNEQNDLITEENSRKIFKECIKTFQDSLKDNFQKNIKEQIQKQEKDFDTLTFYQRQDSFYFDFQEDHNMTIQEFIRYVEDPVKVFEERAEYLQKTQIDPIIELQSKEMNEQIKNNLEVLLQVLQVIKLKIDSVGDEFWIRTQLENYFKIYDQQGNELNFKQKKDITSQLSPIIYQCMSKILSGKFNMQQEFKIQNEKSEYKDYKFIPLSSLMNGPLQYFVIENDSIMRIQSDSLSNQLIKQIVEYFDFNSKKDKIDASIFQIDVTIKQLLAACEEKINEFKTKTFNYNSKYFECEDIIDSLKVRGVGCKSKCEFCGRKCELPISGHGDKHSCDTVGHQMRVFRGGHFQGRTGKNFPSLMTCDMIDPDTTIFIDNNKNNWRNILNTQLSGWDVKFKNKNYKNIDRQMVLKLNAFDQFWLHVGEEYCRINSYNFIKKMKDMQESKQIHESGIIVIALDKSDSMHGQKWKNANNGTKKLIEFLRKYHSDVKKIEICIIHFNTGAEVIYSDQLDLEIPEEIFQRETKGGTEYGPVFELAFQQIKDKIDQKESSKFYFFTDGTAPFPTEELQKIEQDFNNIAEVQKWKNFNGRNKLEILLMNEMKEEEDRHSVIKDGTTEIRDGVMKRMRDKLNSISKAHFGQMENTFLYYQVKPDKIGDLMIQSFESFIFNKDQK